MDLLFGFEINRKSDKQKDLPSFVEKSEDEGISTITAAGGAYGTYLDLNDTSKNDAELVTKYRELAREAEIEYAIDEIINEAIDSAENDVVNVNTDALEGLSEATKKKIRDEFDNIKELLDINNISYKIFRNWYIDGRLYYHVVIDPANPSEGIQELRYIDPRKIKKVKEVKKTRDADTGMASPFKLVKNEYYLYSDKGFGARKPGDMQTDQQQTKALKIAKDSIIYSTSGLMDENNKYVLSYLHKSIRPFNQLRSLENSAVIYALARAPDRRVFYIDVGNLPKAKAEQYLREMMVKHKNRIVYDASTGEMRDDRKHMTMLEDYWFPRREGGRSTEVESLGAGTGISGQLDNMQYFQQNLYKALNIPLSRLNQSEGFTIGRPSEISRDEIKFQKFIDRLRKEFSRFMYQALEKQLILKNVISEDDWPSIKNNIHFEFAIDNHFTEMKNLDVLTARVDVADRYAQYVGTVISSQFLKKKIFGFTDEEIEQMKKEIKQDGDTPVSMQPFQPGGDYGPDIDPDGDQQNSQEADEPTNDAPPDKPAAKDKAKKKPPQYSNAAPRPTAK